MSHNPSAGGRANLSTRMNFYDETKFDETKISYKRSHQFYLAEKPVRPDHPIRAGNKRYTDKCRKDKKEAEYSFAKKRVSMPLMKKTEEGPDLLLF